MPLAKGGWRASQRAGPVPTSFGGTIGEVVDLVITYEHVGSPISFLDDGRAPGMVNVVLNATHW